jgi:two-component system, OmpR family, phosphate regulon sensor histidine kinase PhoR
MIDPAAAAAFEALLARRGGDLLLLVDEGLRIVRAGPEAAALADRPEEELPGMSLIAAFGSAALDAVARQALVGAEALTGEADLGHLGERQFTVDAVPLDGGGLVLSLHDVTALRRMERVRRDFIANISHELRTPLTAIKLLAETLSDGAVDDAATAREFITRIEREADHLAQLVDELLELSMIESGETKLLIEALDPEEVVAACVGRIGPVAERREVRVHRLDPPTHGPLALADPARLGQAMLNLAHNAVKFSRRGGEVRIGWEEAGDRLRFTVADDGIGIPQAHQARIFERFYKVDRSRTRDPESEPRGVSAGLGLAIVRHIAEAHGGTVGMASEEGVGSSFWIEVPRSRE